MLSNMLIDEKWNNRIRTILKSIILVMIIFGGTTYSRLRGNAADVLPDALHYYDHNWLANDWYLNLNIGYREIFNSIFGPIIYKIGFANTELLGGFIIAAAFSIAMIELSRILEFKFAYLVLVIYIFVPHQSLVVGEWILGGVETKPFAYIFSLFSLASFIRKRYFVGLLLAGFAVSFHVLVGLYSLFCLIFAFVLSNFFNWSKYLNLLKHSWVLIVTSFFGLKSAVDQIPSQADVVAHEAWGIYINFRLPHHLLPSAWEGHLWRVILTIATIIFVAVYLLSLKIKLRKLQFLSAYSSGSVMLFGIGLIIYKLGYIELLRFLLVSIWGCNNRIG